MGKYTVEDYLNEMDLTEEEDKKEEEDKEEEPEEEDKEEEKVDEGLDQELSEGLKVLEENLAILFEEAEKRGKVKEVWGKVVGKVKGAGIKVKERAKAGKEAVTKKVTAGKEAVTKKVTAGKEAIKKHPVKTGLAAAGLAAALGGGALAYRRYFSKAAKACKDKKGAEKAACMKKFRAGATEAAIMSLQDNMSHCDNSKNPEKCYARVNEAIEQLRTNLDVLREG